MEHYSDHERVVHAGKEGNRRAAFRLKLNSAEAKLINMIRAIGFGEIEGLKVENGLPVAYKVARKTCKFD